ncbi:MAG TPA: TetR/AcrR family transcriptional regulator [Xanthobacteraceae bacterium]|nr:TetR/AcrR family transcriptional regulator [Xanthobacteraceae bacterium]
MSRASADHATYHHGDLRAALVKAAAVDIERSGYENLSLRELAASLGVSRAAPYRHFADRRALLAAIAASGFYELTAIHRNASGKTPQARLAAAGRGYLAFAAERPQLFRLMLASDLLSGVAGPPDPELIKAANACYEVFEGLVAATLDRPDDRAIKATAIVLMSSAYGFALLRMDNRLKPLMYGRLTQTELIDAVLSMQVTALPRAGGGKRRSDT